MYTKTILTRTNPKPPRLIYLLPETVLWNDVGGPSIMRPQLQRLMEAVSPRLSVQIVPNGAPHPGNEGTFTVATLRGGEEIGFAETALRGILIEDREDISRLKERFDAIWTQALPVGMSVDLIKRTLDEKWR